MFGARNFLIPIQLFLVLAGHLCPGPTCARPNQRAEST
jgi:hypothetical protein